jgi:hypothetical protein
MRMDADGWPVGWLKKIIFKKKNILGIVPKRRG